MAFNQNCKLIKSYLVSLDLIFILHGIPTKKILTFPDGKCGILITDSTSKQALLWELKIQYTIHRQQSCMVISVAVLAFSSYLARHFVVSHDRVSVVKTSVAKYCNDAFCRDVTCFLFAHKVIAFCKHLT